MRRLVQRYRYPTILLRELVRTDFKLRYQGSVLGYLWSLLRPLLLFGILYVIFVNYAKTLRVPHPAVYLLTGVVVWNYFVEVTTGSVGAIVGKGDLLRKINFPKYVIIFAGSVSALISLGLNSIIIAIFMVLNRVELSMSALWLLPLLAELFFISLGMAFFLSALFVKLRDVSYIWEVVMQAGFYLTPILYLLTMFPGRVAKVMILNPLAQIIQDARYVLVTNQTTTIDRVYGGEYWVRLIPVCIAVVIMVIGSLYFRHHSKRFAEDV